ncbi:MAG: restriction endonuclease subunit S [Deltaproteobacteria bacterium]|nr:restriction endonuclease subunit S [Deltaproteobacteria bacterium]
MVEIKKIAEVASGFGFPRKYQGCLNEEFPFFKVGDMNLPGNEKMMVVATNTISAETLKKLRAKPFPRGTVIFPKIGAAIATNKKRMLVQPSVVDNNVMGLIPNQHIDPWYLFYWTQQFDLRTVSNIGPVPSMRKSEVQRVRVPLPPLSEQRRIVEILDQADALRKKRVEADAKAARILSALFYKMFGDPATNPKGWPVKTLGELSIRRPQYGANAKAIDYQEGMPRYVRITDITDDGRLSNADIRSLDMENWDAYRLVEGDLLFARSGATVGKTYLYQPEDGLCAYAGYLIRFQLDRSAIDPWVVFAFTQTPHYQSWVASKRRAAAQPNINGQEYASLPIPQPDRESQEKFVNAVQDLRRLHMKREQSARQIENLFLVLLHRAFTGDLTAQWREAHMQELLAEMEQQAKYLNIQEANQ